MGYISGKLSSSRVSQAPGQVTLHRALSFPLTTTMPNAAPSPCTHPGCGRLVRDGSGRCDKHPRASWVKRTDTVQRITGRKRQKLRDQLFEREPLCRACAERGHVTAATERDHIIPLAEGGTEDEDNVQPLCADCHEAKSREERKRGRQRATS